MAPGEELVVDITFAPIEAGASAGTITVASNDDDESDLVINLSGTGSTGVQVCVDAEGEVIAGDFDADEDVDFQDFFKFADKFGTDETSASWDPAYDLDADGDVDFQDFFKFADAVGKDCTYQ